MIYKQYLNEEINTEEATVKLRDLFRDEYPEARITASAKILPTGKLTHVFWNDGPSFNEIKELTDIYTVKNGVEQSFSQTEKMVVRRRISKPIYKQCFQYLKANNEAFEKIRIMDQAVPGFKNVYEYIDKHLESFDLSNGITEDELTILN